MFIQSMVKITAFSLHACVNIFTNASGDFDLIHISVAQAYFIAWFYCSQTPASFRRSYFSIVYSCVITHAVSGRRINDYNANEFGWFKHCSERDAD